MSNSELSNALALRGRQIRVDENGLACLNDIWRAAGYTKNRRPNDWSRLANTNAKIQRVLKLITGKSRNYDKADMHRVHRTRTGPNGGTYADARLALDYAEYLNPALAIEVKEVFLRFKSADPTLADDILNRSSAEDNEWAGKRALARTVRHNYTDQLKSRGVKGGHEYGLCTNETYSGLFGRTAKELKADRKLAKSASLRDAMSTHELVKVAFSEVLSVERMEAEKAEGFVECRLATRIAASSVRGALVANKRDSQPRLIA